MSVNSNSRNKQIFWASVLRLIIILSVAAVIAFISVFLFAFVAARGPDKAVSSRLCATLVEKESPLAGLFFTTGEIRAASSYMPPRESAESVRSSIPAPVPEQSGALTRIKISGRGWRGTLIRIENTEAYRIDLSAGISGQNDADVSAGLDGYVDAVLISGCLSYAGYGGEDLYCTVACDADGMLHIGAKTVYELTGSNYRWAISADRVLISGGTPCDGLGGGYSSRAAVGQTSDGRIIIAYASSRGVWPCGITYQELAAIMYEYGAVNAASLVPEGSLRVAGSAVAGGLASPDYSLNITAKGVTGVE